MGGGGVEGGCCVVVVVVVGGAEGRENNNDNVISGVKSCGRALYKCDFGSDVFVPFNRGPTVFSFGTEQQQCHALTLSHTQTPNLMPL